MQGQKSRIRPLTDIPAVKATDGKGQAASFIKAARLVVAARRYRVMIRAGAEHQRIIIEKVDMHKTPKKWLQNRGGFHRSTLNKTV